jgi:hypothetical protein
MIYWRRDAQWSQAVVINWDLMAYRSGQFLTTVMLHGLSPVDEDVIARRDCLELRLETLSLRGKISLHCLEFCTSSSHWGFPPTLSNVGTILQEPAGCSTVPWGSLPVPVPVHTVASCEGWRYLSWVLRYLPEFTRGLACCCTVQQPRRQLSSDSLPWETQISRV